MKRLSIVVIYVLFVSTVACAANDIEVYFSPEGGCTNRIVEAIDAGKSYIDVAMYSFTSRPIAWALVRAHDRGVKIRILLDSAQAFERYSKGRFLAKKGIKVVYYHYKGLMHNKICIIDGKLLFTGSFNWTASAEKYNQENMLVIHIPAIIKVYQKRIDYLFKMSEETM